MLAIAAHISYRQRFHHSKKISMKKVTAFTTVFALLALMMFSCTKLDLDKDLPKCIKSTIRRAERGLLKNPPISVWEWKVDGDTYFYMTFGCCDQYNYLYDENCNEICAWDGGFAGAGDGTCPEFNGPIEKTLIWEKE